ncbi:hypothetical protein Pcinc_007865 [Petrolisthes cinctipes]|uniref:Transposase n=1 Tax=Petrolisthes cinctipes TaxID=88211 RepID=A0AAE1G8L9_PETCI|nr:hypothetical protein Pcinc_007865 [Petrolisthes cinctipes]
MLHQAGIHHRTPARKERLIDQTSIGYDRPNIVEEARSGHVACNVWGWVCRHGMGDVYNIEGRFTAEKYIALLADRFLPSLRERNYLLFPGPIIFIHDGCPIHTAHAVRR